MSNEIGTLLPGKSDAGALDRRVFLLALGTLMVTLTGCVPRAAREPGGAKNADAAPDPGVALQDPSVAEASGDLLDAMKRRRSVRSFTDTPVSEEHVARMLWAAQGVTDSVHDFRAAPSAGALYPLELYVASAKGVGRYVPKRHELEEARRTDVRVALAGASLGQMFVAEAPVVFVITGVYERTAAKYGDRAARYVHIEAGHAAQNILLVATSLGFGSVPVGAFADEVVREVVGAAHEETPLYVIPVGAHAE